MSLFQAMEDFVMGCIMQYKAALPCDLGPSDIDAFTCRDNRD